MSNLCEWNVITNTKIGSDHFPILCSINFDMHAQEEYTVERWCFPKADQPAALRLMKEFQWRVT